MEISNPTTVAEESIIFSHYVPNSMDFDDMTNEKTVILSNWLQFKDQDYALSEYGTRQTQCIYVFEDLEFSRLKENILELAMKYKNIYDLSNKSEFLKDVLKTTINLNKAIHENTQYIVNYGVEQNNYTFYRYRDRTSTLPEFIDIAVPDNRDITYVLQYLKRANEFIESFDFQSLDESNSHSREPYEGFQISVLKDLFKNEDDYERSLNALRLVNPAVIDDKNKYLLGPRSKSAFTAWLFAIRKHDLIYHSNDRTIAKLLNEKIVGLNMGKDGKTLRKPRASAYNKYYSKFIDYLS